MTIPDAERQAVITEDASSLELESAYRYAAALIRGDRRDLWTGGDRAAVALAKHISDLDGRGEHSARAVLAALPAPATDAGMEKGQEKRVLAAVIELKAAMAALGVEKFAIVFDHDSMVGLDARFDPHHSLRRGQVKTMAGVRLLEINAFFDEVQPNG